MITKFPDPILSQKTQDIKKIDKATRDLIARLWEELEKEPIGIGLAAPQIGEPYSIAVIHFEPSKEQLKKNQEIKPIPKTVLINPKIVWKSKDIAVEKEGCLSIPDIEVEVPRYKKVHVEYLDENGKKQKIKARGLLARLLQHEIDHLYGRKIIDYQ
jgi:peptide deformylase